MTMTKIKLSKEQERTAENILDWVDGSKEGNFSDFVLAGYAGTGKTTLIGHVSRKLHEHNVYYSIGFLAYTGKAALVLGNKLRSAEAFMPLDHVGTIHSLVYRFAGYEGETLRPMFDPKEPQATYRPRLLIVDESSMVTEEMYDDIKKLHIPVLFAGDPGQLPPVNGAVKDLFTSPSAVLQTIHRQAAGNPIIQLASAIRKGEAIPKGVIAPCVARLARNHPDSIEAVKYMRQHATDLDSIFLCHLNATRVRLNMDCRKELGFEGDPKVGDRVVCLQNNKSTGVLNGQFGMVREIDVEFSDTCYQMTIDMEAGELVKTIVYKKAFNQAKHERSKFEINNDRETYKALRGSGTQDKVDLFDYGYAISVHRSQGSEWKRVVLYNEHRKDSAEYRKWLYTGVTRASERLLILD